MSPSEIQLEAHFSNFCSGWGRKKFPLLSKKFAYGDPITTARVTIENFWARRGRDAGETRARTFTNFDRGTVYFRHMGVLVSRICTKVYSEESFGDLSILNTQHINKYCN